MYDLKKAVGNVDSFQKGKKSIMVSIILSESTASLLNLDIPHLDHESSDSSSDSSLNEGRTCKNEDFVYTNKDFVCDDNGNVNYWYNLKNETKKTGETSEIYSDIAFFSKDMSESDSSCDKFDDLSDCNVKEELSTFLAPVKVYTRPLVAIRSMAHSNKIINVDNDICVSTLESELTVTESGWINVCRICHGGESVGNLLSPCRCRGSVALAHISCLERWLKESDNSHCELCQHHYQIIRDPKYSIPMSILLFLRHPGEHFRELMVDVVAFLIYTPTAVSTTYMLMLICESVTKANMTRSNNAPAHFLVFAAIFGMAAIDFTYSSWLMVTFQKHFYAWRDWYRSQCDLKLIVPKRKQHRHRNIESKTHVT